MNIYISRGSDVLGPFTEEQLRAMFQQGTLAAAEPACMEGSSEWSTVGALLGVASAPAPLSFVQPSRTEPLSIVSLVLGILSNLLCGFGFFAAIPAIICGHIARGRIQANSSVKGGGLALAGLITGYLGIAVSALPIIAAIAIPNIVDVDSASRDTAARRTAQNLVTLSSAAASVGHTNEGTVAAWVHELTNGITMTVGDEPIVFRADSPGSDTNYIRHLDTAGGVLIYKP